MKEWGSPVADFSLLSKSRRKHMESGPTALQVSTQLVGTALLGPDGRTSWLSQSLHAPLSHPLPWQLLEWESQKVSTQVAAHIKSLPFDQRTMVTHPVCWECLLMPMNDG